MKNILCMIGRHKLETVRLVEEVSKYGSLYIDGDVCQRCGFVSVGDVRSAIEFVALRSRYPSQIQSRLDVHFAVLDRFAA